MSYHLGVDVGTTYTAAAIGREGRAEAATLGTRSVSIPTVVCLAGDRLLVGEPAARRAVTEPGRVAREFKRRVGDPTPLLLGGSPVSAELCMARVVEWVVTQVSATEGEPPASLALTHPANWGEYKLDLLRQAVHHVGLTVDRFVPEPVAAATAYAAQRSPAPGTVVAVYDLGGGTFDAALVRAGSPDRAGAAHAGGGAHAGAQIMGRPDGVERLGGVDFDQAVFRFVLEAIGLDLDRLDPDDTRTAAGLAQLREECVDAKEALSHESDVSIPVMLPARHTEVRLTRREFEAMIRPALDETLVALRRTVASAGLQVDDVAAVLLVGGSSRIPLVSRLVTHELGLPVAVDARPKDAISLGAALVTMTAAAAADPAAAPTSVRSTGTGAAPVLPARAAMASPPPPPGDAPLADGASAARSRALVGAVAAIVVLAAVLAGLSATRGGSDDPQTAAGDHAADESGNEATPDPRTSGETSATTGPTGDTDGSGGVDPGGLGALGGLGSLGGLEVADLPTPSPMPGDDWSDAARAQFVADCAPGLGGQASALGSDPESLCGCVYDDVSSRTDFATFNAVWSSDEFDPNSEMGQALTSAMMTCMVSAGA